MHRPSLVSPACFAASPFLCSPSPESAWSRMSHTTDTNNLFQSDAQHARADERARKARLYEDRGSPIKLSTIPLRVVVTQGMNSKAEAWIAESGWVVRRLEIETGITRQIYRGHLGPVTSLDFYTIPPTSARRKSRKLLISGSWDKSFRVWDTTNKAPLSTTVAHIDFIKSLIVIASLKILVTGSSDKDLRIWDLSSLDALDLTGSDNAPVVEEAPEPELVMSEPTLVTPTITKTGAAPPAAVSSNPLPFLLALKGHTRPIERLTYYHVLASSASGEDEEREHTGRIALISVDSLGAMKIWEIWRDQHGAIRGELRSETRPHEIGINDMVLGDEEMWTASSDNSVLLSTFDPSSPSTDPTPILRIVHAYQIRSLLPLPVVLPSLNSSHLLTGAVDESIRILDLSLINSSTHPPLPWSGIPLLPDVDMKGLIRRVDGHSHDVVDLHVYTRQNEESGKSEAWILSAGVDGTLRRWKWPEILEQWKEPPKENKEEEKEESLLTAEEEAELEALMADD